MLEIMNFVMIILVSENTDNPNRIEIDRNTGRGLVDFRMDQVMMMKMMMKMMLMVLIVKVVMIVNADSFFSLFKAI